MPLRLKRWTKAQVEALIAGLVEQKYQEVLHLMVDSDDNSVHGRPLTRARTPEAQASGSKSPSRPFTPPPSQPVLIISDEELEEETVMSSFSTDDDETYRGARRKSKAAGHVQKRRKLTPHPAALKSPTTKYAHLQGIVDHDCWRYGMANNQELARTKDTLHLNGGYTIKQVSYPCVYAVNPR